MKKSVNLYHASCKPEKKVYSFAQLVLLIIPCVIGVVALLAMTMHEADLMNKTTVAATTKSSMLSDELSALQVQLQARKAPEAKVRVKDALSKEVAAKQRLLNNLNNIDLGLIVNFSELMLGLSKANVEPVSITEFSIYGGKLNIYGEARLSDSVPLWLTKIQGTDELGDVTFSGVDIYGKEDKDEFLFQLSNEVIDQTETGGRR